MKSIKEMTNAELAAFVESHLIMLIYIKAKKEEIIANTVLENETVIEVTERRPLIISVNQNIHLSGNVPDTLLRAKGVRGYFCNKIAHIPYVF